MAQENQYNLPNNGYQNYYEDEEPIDWAAYISKFLLYWKKIAIITCIFGVIGIIAALCQKREYSVAITLAPEAKAGGGSSLGGIASMLGMGNMSMGSSTDALNISLFPDICSSTPFLTQLFDVKITPYVSPKDAKKGVVAEPTTVYKHMTGEDKEKGFIAQIMENIFGKPEEENSDSINISQLTQKQNNAVMALQRAISADVDKKTGVTTISVTLDDKLMATELADTVCSRLQNYIYLYRTKKERENLEYYTKLAEEAQEKLVKAQAAYASSMDFDRDVSLLSVSNRKDRLQHEADLANQIYSQMAQQRELARAKVQEMRPVFAVIEPATLPQRPTKSRKNTVLAFGFVGFILSAAWYLIGKDFLEENLKNIKDKIAEANTATNA